MNWTAVFQIVVAAIASIGGGGAIIWGLSSYLGGIWAKKYLETIKKEYHKEIELYKTQLDMIKENTLRYSGQQFELYNSLWNTLYDLKLSADTLWEEATQQNLVRFSKQLQGTVDEIERKYLLIEEEHYRVLQKLLKEFGEYKLGKIKLIEVFKERDEIDSAQIPLLIENNKEKKKRYEDLINSIRSQLKRQIRG